MSRAIAAILLAAAALLVLPVAASGARERAAHGTVERVLPHVVVLALDDGSFAVVPRAGLRADLSPGDRWAPAVAMASGTDGGTSW